MRRLAVSLLVLAACGRPAGTVERAESDTPRLVVALVIDQLGAAQLKKYMPYLHEDGVFRYGARRGALYTDAEYAYAATYTAPGHTTIYCGAGPWKCGVVANRLWNVDMHAGFASMDDGVHAVIGRASAHASPLRIVAPTVADVLKETSNDRALVASLSIKDRAAIPGGGRKADLTVWFDPVAGGFTTSSFYRSALPTWLAEWNTTHPMSDLAQPWTPEDPSVLRRALGEDVQPGEGQCVGLGGGFPHDPAATTNPNYVFKMTPQSTSHLLKTALLTVDQLQLGQDDTPDFLAVSVSAVDYTGHAFGPDSWEYLETFRRADAMLGAFVRKLEERTEIAVLVTSDHGVGALPEHTKDGGRIYAPTFAEKINGALERKLGAGLYVDGYMSPYLYLASGAPLPRQTVVDATIQLLDSMPEVHGAYDVHEILGRVNDPDKVVAAVAKSLFKGEGGDIFVVPRPGVVVDEGAPEGYGTSHGSPWDYDTSVPVLVWGRGVKHARIDAPVSMRRVASTLSWLLSIPAPKHAQPVPLTGGR